MFPSTSINAPPYQSSSDLIAFDIPRQEFHSLFSNFTHNLHTKFTVRDLYFKFKNAVGIENKTILFFSICNLALTEKKNNFYINEQGNKIVFNILCKNFKGEVLLEETLILNKEQFKDLAKLLYESYNNSIHRMFNFNQPSSILSNLEKLDKKALTTKICYLTLMDKLEYTISKAGMCYGFAFMAIQAFLREDFSKYLSRINFINQMALDYQKKTKKACIITYIAEEIKNSYLYNSKRCSAMSTAELNYQENLKSTRCYFDGVFLYFGLKKYRNHDPDMLRNLSSFYNQDFREVANLFTYKTDFGCMQINKSLIKIWSKIDIGHLINCVLTSKKTIAFEIKDKTHVTALGGSKELGCYFISNDSTEQIFCKEQSHKILKCFDKNDTGIMLLINEIGITNIDSQKSLELIEKIDANCPIKFNGDLEQHLGISLSNNRVQEIDMLFSIIKVDDKSDFSFSINNKECIPSHLYKKNCHETILRYIEKVFYAPYIKPEYKFHFFKEKYIESNDSFLFLFINNKNIKMVNLLLNGIINSEQLDNNEKHDLIFSRDYEDLSILMSAINIGSVELVEIITDNILFSDHFTDDEKYKFLNLRTCSLNNHTTLIFSVYTYSTNNEILNQLINTILSYQGFSDIQKYQLLESKIKKGNKVITSLSLANDWSNEALTALVKAVCLYDGFSKKQKVAYLNSVKADKYTVTELINKSLCTEDEKSKILKLYEENKYMI